MSAKMNAKETIREMLKGIYDDADVNAMQIWKGYDNGTGRTGWHVVPFGGTAAYYGKSVEEVIETIDDIYECRESA